MSIMLDGVSSEHVMILLVLSQIFNAAIWVSASFCHFMQLAKKISLHPQPLTSWHV